MGHACPVEGIVYTAAHNVEPWADQPRRLVGYLWQDQLEGRGTVAPFGPNWMRDVTLLAVQVGEPQYYRFAQRGPRPGEEVSWLEYQEVLAPSEREAKVIRSVAGTIQFDRTPNPGASGSCLFNSIGEVVGIVVWGFTDGTGGAASLMAPWRQE